MVPLAHELKIVNTVCPVTIRRQEDTVDTAREVDFMVVVGGRGRANTRGLTRLGGGRGRPAPPGRPTPPPGPGAAMAAAAAARPAGSPAAASALTPAAR